MNEISKQAIIELIARVGLAAAIAILKGIRGANGIDELIAALEKAEQTSMADLLAQARERAIAAGQTPVQ